MASAVSTRHRRRALLGIASVAAFAFITPSSAMVDGNITIDFRSIDARDTPFANGSSISSRFAALYTIGLNAPPLELADADMPHEISTTLSAYSLSWRELQGTLQRLLLWDAGFVATTQPSQLVRVYVECGRTMDDIVIARDEWRNRGCSSRQCDNSSVATGSCAQIPVKCAANGADTDSISPVVSWSEEQPNADIPHPTLFRLASQSYAIHMLESGVQATHDSCPTSIRLAIPCTHVHNDVAQWCVPKPSGAVSALLVSLRPNMNIRSSGSTRKTGSDSVMPLVWLGVMCIAAVASVAFVLSQRKAKDTKATPTRDVNGKQLHAPATTVSSESELDFVSVHANEKSGAVHLDKMTRSLSALSNFSSNYASCLDLMNASEVLHAFERDPIVLEKRIPMTDIEFTRRLSPGASGDVFVGRVYGQRVAIKQLLQLKRSEVDELEIFAREIQLTATLDHPNIIRMVGVAWTTFQNLALVLEYRSGGDLLNAIRKRGARWSWTAEKLHIAMGIAKAMVYLHDRAHPLVHRDIKSRNILMDAATMEPALCDFGSSRNVSALDVLSTDPAGTILWSAPEVICSQHYTVKADIFSFGIVLAELDTCTLPYTEERDSEGRTVQAIRIAHMVVENRVKPQLTEHCPRFIRELVMRCVKHKPDKRPTANEVLAKLSEAANDCAALWKSKTFGLESI